MDSIISLFTNDMVTLFSIIFKIPFITKMLTCGWDNKSSDLTLPWSSFICCLFLGGWNKHRASHMLCGTLCKMKMGTLSSKIKIFGMVIAEHEAKSLV